MYTRVFSACQNTHTHHDHTTTVTHTHHTTTTTTTTTHNQPTCGSIRLNSEKSPGPDTARIDRLFFLDSMSGGACLFSVGGVICLVISVNERDFSQPNDVMYDSHSDCVSNARKFEASNKLSTEIHSFQPLLVTTRCNTSVSEKGIILNVRQPPNELR